MALKRIMSMQVLLCKHKLSGQKVVLKSVDKRHVKKPKHLQVLDIRREANAKRFQDCPRIAESRRAT
jgi:hypothetical protein